MHCGLLYAPSGKTSFSFAIQVMVSLVNALRFLSPGSLFIIDLMRSSSFFHWCPSHGFVHISYQEPFGDNKQVKQMVHLCTVAAPSLGESVSPASAPSPRCRYLLRWRFVGEVDHRTRPDSNFGASVAV